MPDSTRRRPAPSEHNPYYTRYIDRVPETDIIAVLEAQAGDTERLLVSIGEEKSLQRYEPGKWSIREVVGHVSDAERLFAYRALAFARGEAKPLPGFDENEYVVQGQFDAVPFGQLVDALKVTRASTLALFRTISAEAWDRVGIANNDPISVRALAFVIAGHERHHLAVLRERYLDRA